MTALDMSSKVRPSSFALATRVEDDVIVLNTDSDEFYAMGEVGSRLWELVAETMSIRDLVETMCSQYPEVSETQIRSDCLQFLEDLLRSGLIEYSDGDVLGA